MNKKTSVDVIIPTYNGLPWLGPTIESVLNQTHKNLKLYIIDDGSTDKNATENYVKNLKDPRVHYHKKKNGGQATARNLGLNISSSSFVTFLDSDDIWYSNKLKHQVALLEKKPEVGMVYAFCDVIDGKDKLIRRVSNARRGNLFYYLLGGNFISGSASMVMIRRSVLDDVGVFRDDLLIGEDWELWLRIAKHSKIDYVPQYLAGLRALDGGMQSNHLKMGRGLEYMLPILIDEFKLGIIGRGRLAGSCLSDATIYYFNGRDLAGARRTIWKLFWYNPVRFIRFKWLRWQDHVRVLIPDEGLRLLRRIISPSYRRRAKLK